MGYWVVRTYEAGSVGEKTKFWIPGDRPTRNKRKEKSEIKKQEQNETSTVKNLARLLNANFGQGDILLGLDYSAEGMKRVEKRAREMQKTAENDVEWQELLRMAAEHELRLVLRRVKREIGELQYIGVTSDMDGNTGEVVRVHHHLVIRADAKESFVGKWKELGGVDWSYMGLQDDYMPIAEYLLRQVRRVPAAKKYISSRNLVRPEPKDRAVASGAELRVPKNARLVHRNEFKPGMPQYIRYILPEAADDIKNKPGKERSRRE